MGAILQSAQGKLFQSQSRLKFLTILFPAVSLAVLLLTVPNGLAVDDTSKPSAQPSVTANGGYLGSKACANCHKQIYEQYSRTDMGRSISVVTPSLFEKIRVTAKIFDQRSNRYLEVRAENAELFQTEYEKKADGTDLFRDTHKLEWIIGSGANGFGAIVRRDDFLFEAPLSFYSKTHNWAFSPGYEFRDYGFSRPILPGCISCHSGRPRPVADGNGRFHEPPFSELAIGCENCHGPGAVHVLERLQDTSARAGNDNSIVNPARLPSWLADNICMSCHQAGDVSALKTGKTFQDFRPGNPLDDTLSIFTVPIKRESPPQSDLLQHYLSMTLSKCYRGSGAKLSCITCHDPHVQPTAQEAPNYYRQKCLTCHTEKSCAVPLTVRQHKDPPDYCAGCHMPKRDVKVISHSVLTNHRIVAEAEEPYPETAFHMTSPQLPDLVHVNAIPGRDNAAPSPLTLLQAYGQLISLHPEYREKYFSLAKQLEPSYPDNISVLEALAWAASDRKNAVDDAAAIGYLRRALEAGATSPPDFQQVASLLIRAGKPQEAAEVLQRGIKLAPYDAALYQLLAQSYGAMNKASEACKVQAQAVQVFPQDSVARALLEKCANVAPGN